MQGLLRSASKWKADLAQSRPKVDLRKDNANAAGDRCGLRKDDRGGGADEVAPAGRHIAHAAQN